MAKRRKFTPWEKQGIYDIYKGRCALCGKPVKMGKMTIDHITPLSQNGTNRLINLQLACRSCNLAKANLTNDQFMEQIYRIAVHNWRWYRSKGLKWLLVKRREAAV